MTSKNTVEIKLKVDTREGKASLSSFEKKGISAFQKVSSTVEKLKEKLLPTNSLLQKIGLAFAGWKLSQIAAGFISTASSMEKYQTTLASVLHSTEKAKEYMEWIRNFAASTPFEIPELVEAATRLEAYGLSAKKYMRILGDASAALGKNIMDAVEMIADASQGEYERMKEFGLRSIDIAKRAGFKTVQEMTSTRENLIKGTEALLKILEERYSGGMKAISYTWQGMVSNLRDSWTMFKQDVMSAGLFDWLKAGLRFVMDEITRLKKEGTLKQWAKGMANAVIKSLKGIAYAAAFVADIFNGWKMVWAGLKLSFAYVTEFIWRGIKKIGEAITAITGVVNWTLKRLHIQSSINAEGFKKMADSAISFWKKEQEEQKKVILNYNKHELYVVKVEKIFERIKKLVKEKNKEISKNIEDVVNKSAEMVQTQASATASVVQQATIEQLQAYKTMYDALKEWGYSSFEIQKRLILEQKKKFIQATNDKVLAEKWASAEIQKVWEEDKLRFGSFVDGIKVAYERIKRSAISFAQVAYDSFRGFVENARKTFSDLFYDTFTGQLKSLKDYWTSFWHSMLRIFSDKLAEMAVNWMLGIKKMKQAQTQVFVPAGTGGGLTGAVQTAAQTALQAISTARGTSAVGAAAQTASAGTGGGGAGIPTATGITIGKGLLWKMTTAPSMLKAGWAFKALSKLPGVSAIRTPEGVVLMVGDKPLAEVLSTAGWAGLGYNVLSQFTGLPKGVIPSITSTAGAIAGGIAGASLIGGSLGGPIGAGIGALLGGALGGLFGGGKHHPGKYGWKFEWGGIHIDPQTGRVWADPMKGWRIKRAGKHDNTYLKHFGMPMAVHQYVSWLKQQIQALPDEKKVLLVDTLEKINEQFKSVTFTTHLEALRQQQSAIDTYFKKYYVPALKKTYGELLKKVSQTALTSPKTGSIQLSPAWRINVSAIKKYLNRYAEGGISWKPELALVGEKGPEAHIPLKRGKIPVEIESAPATNISLTFNINAFDIHGIREVIREKVIPELIDAIRYNEGNINLFLREAVYG